MAAGKTGKGSGRGGARKGAGRKPATAAARLRLESLKALEDGGPTPLSVMLTTMRALWAEAQLKGEEQGGGLDRKLALDAAALARDVAPFIHPKLANIDVKGKGFGEVKITEANFYLSADGKVVAVQEEQPRVIEHQDADADPGPDSP